MSSNSPAQCMLQAYTHIGLSARESHSIRSQHDGAASKWGGKWQKMRFHLNGELLLLASQPGPDVGLHPSRG